MGRIFRILFVILIAVIFLIFLFFLIGRLYVSAQIGEGILGHSDTASNEHGVVIAKGRRLYDENGNHFEIKGINYGNLFILEGWMTVNSIGALYNEDGSFKSVNEQGIVEEYEEIYQEELDAILDNRVASGDFTQEQLDALREAYFYAYCTEADFKLIKDMGLNTIRLPMYYRNFMEGADDNLTMRADAFEKLDYFLELARKYDLKVIIDMHGVVGGQSGYEHSGTRRIEFWENETYIRSMCTLWQQIALHYINKRPDLASTVLAYDLVNEPTKRTTAGTTKLQWDVMDRLYRAIREVDMHHVISIEGMWYPTSLPNPKKYGWENVLYQYHFYNWNYDKGTSNSAFYGFMHTLYAFFDYNVPKLIGEFSFFDDRAAWNKYLSHYDRLGWGWTVWSYKIVSVGWWDSSWGLVVNRLNLQNDANTPTNEYKLKLDLRTASFDEIMSVWSNEKTKYGEQEGSYKLYRDGVLYNVLKDYFRDKCVVSESELVD
ncbi:MAG: cellulase family glycosylhydrolase [Clostridia bacterium]|nr:cellulase family glycosylhydrolase [Clostridia bacterium]